MHPLSEFAGVLFLACKESQIENSSCWEEKRNTGYKANNPQEISLCYLGKACLASSLWPVLD